LQESETDVARRQAEEPQPARATGTGGPAAN